MSIIKIILRVSSYLKFIFTFPNIPFIIIIFELSEIFIRQTASLIHECTQGTETSFTALDTVQVYRINIIKS